MVEEVTAIIQDNRGEIGLVQKVDTDEVIRLKIDQSIFLAFF